MELSKKNHGIVIQKEAGMRIKTPYGKDDSDVTGSKKQEQIDSMAGGMDHIGHSITGASANMSGK